MSRVLRLLRYDWPLHFVLLFTNWLPDNAPFLRLRGWLAARFLGSCGRNLRLGRNIVFYNPSGINIGRDVYIAYGCWFMAGDPITIGDEVLFGPYCVVVSSNHSRVNGSFRWGPSIRRPVLVGRGAWVASHVTLTAGCRVGDGALVGAGVVVRDVIPPNSIALGSPATAGEALATDEVGPEGSIGA